MKIRPGITIEGEDYGCIGLTQEQYSDEVDARIDLIEEYHLVGGGGVLNIAPNLTVGFCGEPEEGHELTVELWKAFSAAYYAKFPTFDGYIRIADIDYLKRDERQQTEAFIRKILDEEGDAS